MSAPVDYAQRGIYVLPCIADGPQAKAPHIKGGWHSASTDPDQIRAWWTRWPHAAIAVAVAASGLLVIEDDPRHGGDDRLHDLQRGELGPLPDGPKVISPRGGAHRWLQRPQLAAGVKINPTPWPGIEAPNYVLAPPSRIHSYGIPGKQDYQGAYEWDADLDELALPVTPIRWTKRLMIEVDPPKPARARERQDDWLRTLPAERYARELAGVTPNRGGYVRCPSHKNQGIDPLAHNDSNPSVKLHDNVWFCHGCKRGGTIYDFYALTIGYTDGWSSGRCPLDGADFLALEAKLLDRYEALLLARERSAA